MTTPVERIDVVCTVIFCKQRLLMTYNEKWGAFSLPVTKLRNWQLGLSEDTTRWELGEEAAMRNVAECLWLTSDRLPQLLMDFGDLRQSDRSGAINHYAIQVYGFEVDQAEAGPGVAARWMTVDEILNPHSNPISPTSRALLKAVKEAALDRQDRFPPSMSDPTRTSVSSIAVISDASDDERRWLCQWNERWGRYFLVGGHRHEGEDAEECMVRELNEELGTTRTSDYELRPRQSLKYQNWSTSAWQLTDYDVSTFDVQVEPESIVHLGRNPANRWVSAYEIRSERCPDGKLISPTARRILATLKELPGAPIDWKL